MKNREEEIGRTRKGGEDTGSEAVEAREETRLGPASLGDEREETRRRRETRRRGKTRRKLGKHSTRT